MEIVAADDYRMFSIGIFASVISTDLALHCAIAERLLAECLLLVMPPKKTAAKAKAVAKKQPKLPPSPASKPKAKAKAKPPPTPPIPSRKRKASSPLLRDTPPDADQSSIQQFLRPKPHSDVPPAKAVMPPPNSVPSKLSTPHDAGVSHTPIAVAAAKAFTLPPPHPTESADDHSSDNSSSSDSPRDDASVPKAAPPQRESDTGMTHANNAEGSEPIMKPAVDAKTMTKTSVADILEDATKAGTSSDEVIQNKLEFLNDAEFDGLLADACNHPLLISTVITSGQRR